MGNAGLSPQSRPSTRRTPANQGPIRAGTSEVPTDAETADVPPPGRRIKTAVPAVKHGGEASGDRLFVIQQALAGQDGKNCGQRMNPTARKPSGFASAFFWPSSPSFFLP